MTIDPFVVLIYYKFATVTNPQQTMKLHKLLCKKFDLKGRILISKDGINGTVEGTIQNCQLYINELKNDDFYKDIYFKQSEGDGNSFSKLQVKVRDEIVTTKLDFKDEIGPIAQVTGKYISPEELHGLFDSQEDFYIIDMRNDYEYSVGYFQNSILLKNLHNFRDLPNILPDIEHLKDKRVITVCTSGVRCELASGFLIRSGFSDVSQLKDGIMEYMQQYPNEDFLGKLFVFDNRVVISFHTDSKDRQFVGKCVKCGVSCENFVDQYNIHGDRQYRISCQKCVDSGVVKLEKVPYKNQI